jgi:type I restriction enzyme, S subunit
MTEGPSQACSSLGLAVDEAMSHLPAYWVRTTLGEMCLINPRAFRKPLEYDQPISFVPMAAVEAGTGRMDVSQVRPYGEVRKGYTPFSEGDILFAKITPCMENGKIAIAQGLTNGAGCGSTEFHVLRPRADIPGKLVMYYLLQKNFRKNAQRQMAGTAGQLRVPAWFVTDADFPLPPLPEQHRIVAEIEKHFTRLDAAVASLQRARANLRRYRASVLKVACEGKLVPTEAELARAEGRQYEPTSVLLERILEERRARWDSQEKRRGKYREPQSPDIANLPELPEGWVWARAEQLLTESPANGISIKGSDEPPGVPVLRLSAMSDNGFDFGDRKYMPIPPKVAESLTIHEGEFFVSRGNGSIHLVGRGTLTQATDDTVVFPDTMIRLRLINIPEVRQFINRIWPSGLVRGQIERTARTTAGIYKINQRDIESFVIPLPPLAEQRRIVAEVERHLSVIQAAQNMVEANLKRAERLRQSILQQAFHGKLVPQDPDDEPASVLLERIRAEREQLVKPKPATARRKSRHSKIHGRLLNG